jgi:type I site-specific restriction endonuclease
MANVNTNATQAHDAQVIVGIQKHLLNVSSLPIAGSTYTPADLVKLVQSRIDSTGTVAAANATWHSTVTAHEALSTKLTPVLRGLRQYVLNAFGETSPVLADFGFTAPKTATKTPEQKAAAAAKAQATRKARGTLGKNQKKGVKGAVTATLVVTPQAGSQPTVTTPAPAAGGTTPRTP